MKLLEKIKNKLKLSFIYKYLKELFIIFIIFILGIASKAGVLINLKNLQLIGPDPYLFYRYAYEILHYGHIISPDCLRYYPLCWGIDNFALISYVAVFFYNIFSKYPQIKSFFDYILINIFNYNYSLSLFDFSIHMTPFIMFGIASIFFYLLVKKILKDSIPSFLATLFFMVIPAMIFRNLPFDKEPIALPFLIGSLYFYYSANINKNLKYKIIFYILAAIFTIISSFAWGGWLFIPIVLSIYEFIKIVKEKIENLDIYFTIYYFVWIFTLLLLHRVSILSIKTIIPLSVSIFAIILYYNYKKDLFSKINILSKLENYSKKISKKININYKKISSFVTLLIIGSPLFFIKIKDFINYILSNPWGTRFGSTVAEQQFTNFNTYYGEATGLGLIVSISTLSYILTKDINKTIAKLSFTISLIITSLLLYLITNDYISILIFSISLFATLLLLFKEKIDLNIYKKYVTKILLSNLLSISYFITILTAPKIEFAWILTFVILLYYIISGESKDVKESIKESTLILVLILFTYTLAGYINRLTYLLGFSIPLSFAYIIKEFSTSEILNKYKKGFELSIFLILAILSIYCLLKYSLLKSILWLIPVVIFIIYIIKRAILLKQIKIETLFKTTVFLLLLFGFPLVYTVSYILYFYAPLSIKGTNIAFVSSLEWARNYTEKNAIFSHWWDYGYYVQTIANRTTWIDGGNQIVYWNHLMGRYGLCGNYTEALKLFYVHSDNGTRPVYYLIHPTDIGKMYAFSKVGSNLYYDKLSWITDVQLVGISEDKKSLIYAVRTLLDTDLKINNTTIPRCIPEMNIIPPNCGYITQIIVNTKQPLLYYNIINTQQGKQIIPTYRFLNPKDIESAYIDIIYRNKTYRLKLGCIDYLGEKILFKDGDYKGCLYLTPSLKLMNNKTTYNLSFYNYGLLISPKAMNYIWVRLYFFDEKNPYFKEVYNSIVNYYKLPPLIYKELKPIKIWKVIFPKNFTVDNYTYCLYLATNLKQINECNKKYNKSLVSSIYQI